MDPIARTGIIKQVETFHERMEMMSLAFIIKHGRRPTLVFANRLADRGWMAGFVAPELLDEDPTVHPKLMELARHGERAWRAWTKLEPDEVVILFQCVGPGETRLSIVPRTTELRAQIAGEMLRQLDEETRRN